jgi:hypothetical protein
MAAPAYRSHTVVTNGTTTSCALSLPSGFAANDILIAVVFKENTAAFSATPSGFALVTGGRDIATGFYSVDIYWKRATGAESGSQTFTWSGSVPRAGYMVAISGAVTRGDPWNPATLAAWAGSNSGAMSASSVTTTVDDTLILGVYTVDNGGATWTAGSSMTERIDNGDTYLQTVAQSAAGATGTKDATPSVNNERRALLVPIKPATVSTSTSALATARSQRQLLHIASDGTAIALYYDGSNWQWRTSPSPYSTWSLASAITNAVREGGLATALASNDDVHVVYRVSSGPNLRYRRLTFSSGSWSLGSEQTIADGDYGGGGEFLSVAVDSDERIWVCSYEWTGSNNAEILYSADGTSWTSSLTPTASSSAPAAQVIARAGDYIVAIRPNDAGIYWRRVNTSGSVGSWSSESFKASVGLWNDYQYTALADGNDRLVLTAIPNGTDFAVRTISYQPGSDAWDTTYTDIGTGVNDRNSALARVGNNLYCVWSEYAASNSYAIVYKVWDASGAAWGSRLQLVASGANRLYVNAGSNSDTLAALWTAGTGSPYDVGFDYLEIGTDSNVAGTNGAPSGVLAASVNDIPQYVGAGTAAWTATNAATIAPGLPSGWAADDIHVLIAHRSDNTAMTSLSGWTNIAGLTGNNTAAQRVEVWWRRAVGGDSAPTVTFGSGTVVRGARIIGIRGCPTSGDPFSTSSRSDNAASATLTFATITPTDANTRLIAAYAYEDDPTAASTITNWQPFVISTSSLGNDAAIGFALKQWPTASSATGGLTSTASGGTFANSPNVGILLSLKPLSTIVSRSVAGTNGEPSGTLSKQLAAFRTVAGTNGAPSGVLARTAAAFARTVAGTNGAPSATLAQIYQAVRALTGAMPTATGELGYSVGLITRSLAGAMPASTATLSRTLAALRSLSGSQPASTATLSRTLAALRTVLGSQPTATGVLSRRLDALRAVVGSQPAATGILSRTLAALRALSGSYLAGSGTLSRTAGAYARSLVGSMPASTGVISRLLAALRTLTGTMGAPSATLSGEEPDVRVTVQADWNVRKVAPQAAISVWAVRAAVTPITKSADWHVRQSVSTTTPSFVLWHVRGAVAPTVQADWHVRGAVAPTVQADWHVRGAVAPTITADWRVRQSVTVSSTTEWNVESDLGTTTQTIQATWNVRAAVTPTALIDWHVRAAVAKTTSSEWFVLTAVTPITKSADWHVRAAATQTRAADWHVRAAVSLSLESQWGPFRSEQSRLTYEFLSTQDGSSDFVHGSQHSTAEFVQTSRHNKSEFVHSRR